MKFKSRAEQRKVCETVSSILCSLQIHLKKEDCEAVNIALNILNDTEVEADKGDKNES